MSAALLAEPAVVIERADSFVVVSWWADKSSDGRAGHYEYDTVPSLSDAHRVYRDYENGDYERARAVGIFAVRNGMPVGSKIL